MLRLLAQLSVDGKHLWMTNKGERQDGDGVRRLHKQQQQQRLHLKSPCTKHWMIIVQCSFHDTRLSTHKCWAVMPADLLVDGEQLGRAHLLWRGFAQCVVAERLQGAADVEPFVDDLR